MRKLDRQDLIFYTLPFAMTAITIVVGYNILVASTPEASINPTADSNLVEILSERDVEVIKPTTSKPELLEGPIKAVPHNQAQLKALINSLTPEQTVVFLSVPVLMSSDESFTLSGAEQSNEENIKRWVKATTSQVHRSGRHVILSMTLNATTTIQNPGTFALSYANFLEPWAVLANESAVTFFQPGLTIGHPLYTNVTPDDQQKILSTINQKLRADYLGKIGVGVCCTLELTATPRGYNFASIIPTPEFPFVGFVPVVSSLQGQGVSTIIYYDRDRSVVTSVMP